MLINDLLDKLKPFSSEPAIILDNDVLSYGDILKKMEHWDKTLLDHDIHGGEVTALIGDYSADAIPLILSLIRNNNIIVPVSPLAHINFDVYFKIAHVRNIIELKEAGATFSKRTVPEGHVLLNELVNEEHPGLILFTSGSTGEPKAVVHDFEKLLSKFKNANKKFRTLCFLLFDHIAGIDTYFYSLFSGGTAVFPSSRNPGYICSLIEKYHIEVLPTSPTFLNLLLISEAYKEYNLDSLKVITYGSEKMPEPLLKRLESIFNKATILQKYGVTELGSPPSKSKSGDSSWIKMDSDAFRIKIIDGILHIKTDTAMLGYLNAKSPFTEDGWFNTGDAAVQEGEYIKILGRKSDIINVGGEKVYPAEVESTIMAFDNVMEVSVFGEKNPITGKMVCAKIRLINEESPKAFRKRLKTFCFQKLDKFKVPAKISIVDEKLHNSRFKITRREK